jgi:hypothetical protein
MSTENRFKPNMAQTIINRGTFIPQWESARGFRSCGTARSFYQDAPRPMRDAYTRALGRSLADRVDGHFFMESIPVDGGVMPGPVDYSDLSEMADGAIVDATEAADQVLVAHNKKWLIRNLESAVKTNGAASEPDRVVARNIGFQEHRDIMEKLSSQKPKGWRKQQAELRRERKRKLEKVNDGYVFDRDGLVVAEPIWAKPLNEAEEQAGVAQMQKTVAGMIRRNGGRMIAADHFDATDSWPAEEICLHGEDDIALETRALVRDILSGKSTIIERTEGEIVDEVPVEYGHIEVRDVVSDMAEPLLSEDSIGSLTPSEVKRACAVVATSNDHRDWDVIMGKDLPEWRSLIGHPKAKEVVDAVRGNAPYPERMNKVDRKKMDDEARTTRVLTEAKVAGVFGGDTISQGDISTALTSSSIEGKVQLVQSDASGLMRYEITLADGRMFRLNAKGRSSGGVKVSIFPGDETYSIIESASLGLQMSKALGLVVNEDAPHQLEDRRDIEALMAKANEMQERQVIS